MQEDLFNEGVIEESFKADCDIGNKTLYALCEKYPLYDNPSEDALSRADMAYRKVVCGVAGKTTL